MEISFDQPLQPVCSLVTPGQTDDKFSDETGLKSFLVKFNNSTKVVKSYSGNPDILTKTIKEEFDIDSDISLQIFNKEWDSFIDLNNNDTPVPNKSKLNVIKTTVTKAATNHTYKRTSDNWIDMELDENKFSTPLKETLKKCESLNWKLKNELLNHIQDKIFENTIYPTSDQLGTLSKNIVIQFPALKEDIGSGFDGLKQTIINKLKNSRRSLKSPEVCVKKRKKSDHCSITVKTLTKLKVKGVVNWAPAAASNQDEDKTKTCDDFIEEIKAECSKVYNRDLEKIGSLMKDTFKNRWDLVVSGAPVKTVIETYPGLKIQKELESDFIRLMEENIKSNKEVVRTVKKYTYATLALSEERKKKSEFLASLLKKLKETKDTMAEVDYNKRAEATSILNLPELLESERELIFIEYPETVSTTEILAGPVTPHVASVGPFLESSIFYIIVENNILCDTKDLVEATMILFKTFYVFNIEYPKKAENFYFYIQNCMMDIKSQKKPSARLIHFWEKVKKKCF